MKDGQNSITSKKHSHVALTIFFQNDEKRAEDCGHLFGTGKRLTYRQASIQLPAIRNSAPDLLQSPIKFKAMMKHERTWFPYLYYVLIAALLLALIFLS